MSKREEVLLMFKENKSVFDIHMNTGLAFSEITHYVREDVEAKARHKKKLRDYKDEQRV